MSRVETTTNFRDSFGTDLGRKLVTKDYLISVYPEIGDKIGIPPELWTWGPADGGRLGNALLNAPLGPVTPITTFAGGANWKQVSAGDRHTAAIKTDGTLWTWGTNYSGQLGNAQVTNRSTPVTTFAGGTNWRQVSCGYRATSAIKTDGTLWTWGSNARLILGNNSTSSASTPVTTFAGGTNWRQVSFGRMSFSPAAAIKTDGTLWTWGYGNSGQLGNSQITNRSTPVTTFAGGTNWKQVSSGGDGHTAAIKTDGTLWTWGNGSEGRLGNAVTTGNRSTPVTTFAGGTNWKQVSCGSFFMTAIKTDGTLWTWGSGSFARLGNNSTTLRSTPVTTFAGGTNWKQVDGGGAFHIAAIKTDGTLWTWGYQNNGGLGNAGYNPFESISISTPITTFAGGIDWKQVSVGESHTAAIKSVDFSPF
jgi:alpha-tubulin suppressor-like RCC1 family protein